MCINTVNLILECEKLSETVIKLRDENGGHITLKYYFKFGSDGSNGHPIFKQILNSERDQGSVYATGMVSMQIVCELPNGEIHVVYDNPLVNSSLSWRPLHLWFVKETLARIKIEKDRLFLERKELNDFEYQWCEGVIVKFIGFYSMCDKKVQNGYLDNRHQATCGICGAKPSQVNEDLDFDPREEAICELCIATLHFTIRTFEHLIKIGAKKRANVLKYIAKGKENQDKIKEAMNEIIKNFHDKLGLDIFQPRDGGRGSSNDGNTCRTAFQHPEFLAEQTGLSLELIKRLNFIRIALAKKDKKHPEKFPAYCKATKDIYNKECGWYPANPTLHKVFDHSGHFLNVFPPTISTGMISEEPGEAANKDLKKFQIEHAFQGDPERRNLDTMHRLIDRSNPQILKHLVDKKLEKRDNEPTPDEVLDLLL